MSFPSSALSPRPGFPFRFAAWLRRLRGPRTQLRQHPFDMRHGVDTEGLLYAPELDSGHAHDRHNEGYYATAPSLFQGAMERWRQTLNNCSVKDYAFIDLGCGKGRVLMLASQWMFQAVHGLELNPALARDARRNLRRWLRKPRACRRVTVECSDVLGLRLPDAPVILFLFNSFGAEVLAALMQPLAEAAQRRIAPIDLVYVHPDHGALVAATPGIERLTESEVPFSQEDAAADAFGVHSDGVAIYRIHPGKENG